MTPVKWGPAPEPLEAYAACFGFVLHHPRKSATVFTDSGTLGPTHKTKGLLNIVATAMKSFSGSKFTDLNVNGTSVKEKSGVTNMVVPSGGLALTKSDATRVDAPGLASMMRPPG